jgi:hypothetical protein
LEIPPARFLVVCTAGDESLDIAALRVCYLQRRVREAVDSNNVLLKEPDD